MTSAGVMPISDLRGSERHENGCQSSRGYRPDPDLPPTVEMELKTSFRGLILCKSLAERLSLMMATRLKNMIGRD